MVVKTPPERDTLNYAAADPSGEISLLPSAVPQDERVVQFGSPDSNTNITDFNG